MKEKNPHRKFHELCAKQHILIRKLNSFLQVQVFNLSKGLPTRKLVSQIKQSTQRNCKLQIPFRSQLLLAEH